MAVLQKTFIRSSQVINHGSMRMRPKQNTVYHVGLRRQAISNESCFWKNHFKTNGDLFFLQSWRPFQLCIVGRSILSGTTICLPKVFGEIGVVSITVEKQTQMMVVHQKILSSIMLKKVKLFYGNVRFQLAICLARINFFKLKNVYDNCP